MRIWNFLVIYSCWSDAGKKKQSANENDTAVVEKQAVRGQVFLKNVIPPDAYKVFEKSTKKEEMREKVKVKFSDQGFIDRPCRSSLKFEARTQDESSTNKNIL